MENYFGKKLKSLREDEGYSQEELGKMIGKKNTAISNYERGVSVPPMKILRKLASIFQVKTSELLESSNVNEAVAVYGGNVNYHKNGDAVKERWSFLPDGNFDALIMKGNSLTPDIKAGDLVVFESKPTERIQDQMLAVVYVSEDEYSLGVIQKNHEDGTLVIYPLNKNYNSSRVDLDKVARIHPIVVSFERKRL